MAAGVTQAKAMERLRYLAGGSCGRYVCPVCNATGLVAGRVLFPMSQGEPARYRSCMGTGIVWAAETKRECAPASALPRGPWLDRPEWEWSEWELTFLQRGDATYQEPKGARWVLVN